MSTVLKPVACVLLSLIVLAGCERNGNEAGKAAVAADPAADVPVPAPVPEPAAQLQDVIETTNSHIVGVSYGPTIRNYPGLAEIVGAHSVQARAELMEAVEAFGNDQPPAPYELSLTYRAVLETSELVAVSADGSRYTGGAHGEPIVERFVWLPKQQRLLTAEQLVPEKESWSEIGGYVREQLHTSLSLRADADNLGPEDRSRLVRAADRQIREGTAADVANFSSFEPQVDGSGKITALRFIFPPYQVGPYADGTQSVDVPAEVLLPHVAAEYRGLFARG